MLLGMWPNITFWIYIETTKLPVIFTNCLTTFKFKTFVDCSTNCTFKIFVQNCEFQLVELVNYLVVE